MTTFTNDQIADQLVSGYWGGTRHPLMPSRDRLLPWERPEAWGPNNPIIYDISSLTEDGQFYAQRAFQVWSDASGLAFQDARDAPYQRPNILFDDDQPGAFAYRPVYRSVSSVNISEDWIKYDEGALDTYSFQTYIHEIGHALGLGHSGNYNGPGVTYEKDAHYDNDSWQASIMSYFSQTENTAIDGSYAYAMTPQVADIIAIQSLYGTTASVRNGDTRYGNNSNAGGIWDEIFTSHRPLTATIVDSGGYDTLDVSGWSVDQTVNLNPEGISSVRGLTGNLVIARSTIIEQAVTGSGNDTIHGNNVANRIFSGSGNDVIHANAGNDYVRAGNGNDIIYARIGENTVFGDSGDDFIYSSGIGSYHGGSGNDVIYAMTGTAASGRQEILTGGYGIDTLDTRSFNGDYEVNLQTGKTNWRGETFLGFENIRLGDGNDTATGTYTANYLKGGGGADTLYGNAGDDTLDGESGNDNLIGGDGSDRLFGGANNDRLHGGDGNDFLSGGDGADQLRGDLGDDKLYGGGANDRLSGLSGNDVAYGGSGNDRLSGHSGNDRLFGGTGHDILNGGSGADYLVGGSGNDILYGGSQGDTFVFNLGTGFDLVKDFEIGLDKILVGHADLSFSSLVFSQDENGTGISWGADSLLLEQMEIAQLSQDDFIFVV